MGLMALQRSFSCPPHGDHGSQRVKIHYVCISVVAYLLDFQILSHMYNFSTYHRYVTNLAWPSVVGKRSEYHATSCEWRLAAGEPRHPYGSSMLSWQVKLCDNTGHLSTLDFIETGHNKALYKFTFRLFLQIVWAPSLDRLYPLWAIKFASMAF